MFLFIFLFCVSFGYSQATILKPVTTQVNGENVTYYSISDNEYCSPLDDPEKNPIYMRKGTIANSKLKKFGKKLNSIRINLLNNILFLVIKQKKVQKFIQLIFYLILRIILL